MSRFIVIVALCLVMAFMVHSWRQKRQKKQQVARAAKQHKAKQKGRLVQDPETGDYRVEADDK